MAIPSVRTSLTSSAPAINPQDLSAIAMVVGPASDGPINVPTQINSLTNLADFAHGPGPEMVGDILSVAGGPVYFTRSETTTEGALIGDVTKTGGEAAAEDVFGAIILPGADHDGDVLFRSLQEGVTLTVVVGGAAAYTRSGTDITLTVTNTTTGSQVVALALGTAAGYIAQPALSGDSTGASVCGQALSQTAFDRGTLVYTALGAGCYLVPGADANGGVIFLTQQKGVSVEVIQSGNNAPLVVYREGSKLAVRLETDGSGAVLSTADDVVAAVADSEDAAFLEVTATATGTGAGLADNISETDLDPVRIAHTLSGLSTALAVSLSGRTVTVTQATNADGNATSTATAVLSALISSASASTVLSAALLGSGAGLVGPQAAMDLDFGGTGDMAISGTPVDSFWVRVKIIRAGTVGTAPYPTMIWAVDYLAGESTTPTWSGVTLIPASGEVALSDGSLDTGLTVTFTGDLEADDEFLATTSAPTSNITSIIAAMDAAKLETRFEWGFLTGPDPVSRANVALIDARVRGWFDEGSRFVRAQWNTRDIDPGETVTEYQDALYDDFLGYVSPRGRCAVSAGATLMISAYTLRQYRRGTIFAASSRKASIPCHENLGKVATGPLANVLYLFFDESKYPSLFDQRFIVPITYAQKPGSLYLAGAPTMADPSAHADAGYTLVERIGIASQIARIASIVALNSLNDSLPGTAAADRASGAVAGAIDLTAAGTIEARTGKAIETFLFAIKSDGKASATPLAPKDKYCKVRRDNNFLADQTVYQDVKWIPLGLAKYIVITVNTTIPS